MWCLHLRFDLPWRQPLICTKTLGTRYKIKSKLYTIFFNRVSWRITSPPPNHITRSPGKALFEAALSVTTWWKEFQFGKEALQDFLIVLYSVLHFHSEA